MERLVALSRGRIDWKLSAPPLPTTAKLGEGGMGERYRISVAG